MNLAHKAYACTTTHSWMFRALYPWKPSTENSPVGEVGEFIQQVDEQTERDLFTKLLLSNKRNKLLIHTNNRDESQKYCPEERDTKYSMTPFRWNFRKMNLIKGNRKLISGWLRSGGLYGYSLGKGTRNFEGDKNILYIDWAVVTWVNKFVKTHRNIFLMGIFY